MKDLVSTIDTSDTYDTYDTSDTYDTCAISMQLIRSLLSVHPKNVGELDPPLSSLYLHSCLLRLFLFYSLFSCCRLRSDDEHR